MTDPLTGKELVQKSYEYIDRLTKECAKFLLDDYNKSHKKFESANIHSEIALDIKGWFDRRDKNIKLTFDSASITRSTPIQSHMKFNGSTKDADFVLSCSLGVFTPPSYAPVGKSTSFLKTLAITADKASFAKR